MNFFLTTTLAALLAITTTTSAQPLHQAPGPLRLPSRAPSPPSVGAGKRAQHTGRMTYYTPGQGSCGATNTEADLVVAVSSSVFGTYADPNDSPVCQDKVTITCGSSGTTVTAAVVDLCESCGADDIDVSPAVFSQCGDLSVGTMTVSWDLS